MKTMILKTMMMAPTMTMIMKTPMSMGMMLMIQTFACTMLINKISPSSWMAMIVFLMMVGGLLVLFMYMSSIASNEKFKTNYKVMLIMIITFLLSSEEMMLEMMESNLEEKMKSNEAQSLSMIFMKKYFKMSIMMFMTMLITMISSVSIVQVHKGPLRKTE